MNVPQRAPGPPLQEPTTIGGYVLAISKALQASGVDSTRVLKAVGIPLTMTNDPMSRLPVSTLTRLFRACTDVTGNPYFGLTVARFIHISNLHALGYALAASANLMEFCQRLERYFRLASQTCEIKVVESKDELELRIRLLVDVSAETEDAFLGFVVLAMRQLYKPEFNPLRVALSHPPPREDIAPYEALFRAPVSFGQSDPMLVLPRADIHNPLIGACAELAQLNDNLSNTYLARLEKDDVVTRVRQKIIEFLPNGSCTRDKVASALAISPTTLQFKLSERGTSFHELLDATRKELASGYVQQSSLSITEITFLLGFSDTSNFTRAFKRWQGVSPTSFRDGEKAVSA
ncbi:AraC family transcriptional regulator [Variovorax sp. J22R24]|uniref:AraC family transcriptional regulator n=1 Tax=Variovorax TaxID=34072 RepID=UPI0025791641|nr:MULTISPECIES: AraC family transcriptional regulator [unclassified Variovorax]MDM0050462.1 AraC family transcriptional regulator [Variovorax sp. J22R115]MDM0110129.1 AraC family transcriptional regulator [Variovorax sp. J22R24]